MSTMYFLDIKNKKYNMGALPNIIIGKFIHSITLVNVHDELLATLTLKNQQDKCYPKKIAQDIGRFPALYQPLIDLRYDRSAKCEVCDHRGDCECTYENYVEYVCMYGNFKYIRWY